MVSFDWLHTTDIGSLIPANNGSSIPSTLVTFLFPRSWMVSQNQFLTDSTYAFLFCDTRSCLGQENTQRYIIIWTIIQRSLYCHIIICMSALFLQVKSNNSKFALCLCMTASWHKQGTAATLVEITKDY